eukprot:1142832-Pelagomonas_calceolata.AAC.1
MLPVLAQFCIRPHQPPVSPPTDTTSSTNTIDQPTLEHSVSASRLSLPKSSDGGSGKPDETSALVTAAAAVAAVGRGSGGGNVGEGGGEAGKEPGEKGLRSKISNRPTAVSFGGGVVEKEDSSKQLSKIAGDGELLQTRGSSQLEHKRSSSWLEHKKSVLDEEEDPITVCEVGRGTLHGLAAAALSSRMSELGVQNEPSRLLNAACILSKGEKRLHHTAGVVGLHK